jgi:hypothetical protein
MMSMANAPQEAALKAHEIFIETGAPPPGYERLAKIEYRDAQRADGTGAVMTFARRRDMVAWFKEQAREASGPN